MALAAAFLVSLALPGLARAEGEGDDLAIRAIVKDQQRDANGKADNKPVEGVEFVVTDESGVEVARAVSDAKGVALLSLPGRAVFTVTLVEDSLPDGLVLDAGSPAVVTVDSNEFVTSTKALNFFTGASQSRPSRSGSVSLNGYSTESDSDSCSPCARSDCP